MSSSATNHVSGLKNGSDSGWWTQTVPEGTGSGSVSASGSGSGSGSGTSSSTSWSGSWYQSYDETVSYPGFYEGAYYAGGSGGYSGGGGSPEEYFAYIGDAFSGGSSPGSSGSGLFPFAYSDEEFLSGQAQGGGGALGVGRNGGGQQRQAVGTGVSARDTSALVDPPVRPRVRPSEHGRSHQQLAISASQEIPNEPEGNWTPEKFFGTGFFGLFPSPLIRQTRFGCGGLAAWRAGCQVFDPDGVNQYHPAFIQRLPGTQKDATWQEAVEALKALGDEGGLIIAIQYGAAGAPANYATLSGDKAGPAYWGYANHGWQESTSGALIIHSRRLPQFPKTEFMVIPGKLARFKWPIPPAEYKPLGP
ncbi:hypothetical protein [Thermogutta sp.]|uniref:hypothetical protein n=1 Tax=Thermogutta sp. TaxID=1962930 RepID=UPI00321FD89B